MEEDDEFLEEFDLLVTLVPCNFIPVVVVVVLISSGRTSLSPGSMMEKLL